MVGKTSLCKRFMKKAKFKWDRYVGKSNVTKKYVSKILRKIRDRRIKEKIKKIISSDIIWDKIVKIKRISNFDGYVYDLSVPPWENFIVNNIVVKNSSDPWLKNYDLIVCSNEKMDSLIRHGADWIKDIGLIVADEVHLLDQPERGPTLEIVLTILRKLLPKVQILALSATIKNAEELAEWLNAKLVFSEWRPVKLYQGIAFPYRIKFLEKEGYELDESLPIEASIVKNTLKLRKQALFFVSTRRSAESLAEKLGKVTREFITRNEKKLLEKIADEIENVLEVPTKQCKRIARCVRCGAAFHHAGLLYKQKKLIEENFRRGLIKIIVATPTLAFGVDLPSFRVIMRDLRRYRPGIGSTFVSVLEVQQMLGRAGRPRYDSADWRTDGHHHRLDHPVC